jgi:hypothetical protein
VLAKAVLRAGVVTLLVFSSLLVVAVPPTAAVIVTMPCTGLCGHWQVQDSQQYNEEGATCLYPDDLSSVDKITVRPPEMYGRYTLSSTVGWRFIIQAGKVSGWTSVYTSPYQNAQANLLASARDGYGFSRRGWSGPFGTPYKGYRVLVEMRWQQNGSTEGYVQLRYNWYKVKAHPGESFAAKQDCESYFVY